MFHFLSFCGHWDPSFFEKEPEPQKDSEDQKEATDAAVQARAKLRLAKKYDNLKKKRPLYPEQEELVESLHDGTLQKEANRLTILSGHGRVRQNDGTFVDIGGSTGGFTRAVLYNWTPPTLDEVFQ